MFKPKIIFPDRDRLESPYQLEDCQRRLRNLRRNEVQFEALDADHIAFSIRHIKSVTFPMVAYEIHGTLRRWAGTGTIIEDYRLQRLSVRVDTWVVLFVVISLLTSALLMLPAIMADAEHFRWLMSILILAFGIGLIPMLLWIKQTRALNMERDIDDTHTAIMTALGIQSAENDMG